MVSPLCSTTVLYDKHIFGTVLHVHWKIWLQKAFYSSRYGLVICVIVFIKRGTWQFSACFLVSIVSLGGAEIEYHI